MENSTNYYVLVRRFDFSFILSLAGLSSNSFLSIAQKKVNAYLSYILTYLQAPGHRSVSDGTVGISKVGSLTLSRYLAGHVMSQWAGAALSLTTYEDSD